MSEIKTNKISPRKGTTQTIGDSGDTVSIPCGVTVTNAGTITTSGISGGTINNTTGTISGLQGVIDWDTTAKTTNFNASSQAGYFVDTTSGAITVTFPASPTAGDVIALKDYALTADTNNIIINPNGNNINGSSSNYIINTEGSAAQFIYVDATRGWVLTDASKASDIAEKPTFTVATGGTITCCGDYKIHTFTGPGTFTVTQLGNGSTVPTGGPATVSYMVVAGGGGSGTVFGGGGGGAGGFREGRDIAPSYTASPLVDSSGLPVSVTAYPIQVGGGGTAGTDTPNVSGGQGNNSVFSTITSAGGGGGVSGLQASSTITSDGGSGGGGAHRGMENVPTRSPDGAAGFGNTPPVSPPQGNDGGAGQTVPFFNGGGGGGATGTGTAGANPNGGPGGAGATTSISGTPTAYAGGGGGGGYVAPGGTGGTGGGGPGGPQSTLGTNGTTNTGGGAGGSGGLCGPRPGATGGSGIVIIRYKYQ